MDKRKGFNVEQYFGQKIFSFCLSDAEDGKIDIIFAYNMLTFVVLLCLCLLCFHFVTSIQLTD